MIDKEQEKQTIINKCLLYGSKYLKTLKIRTKINIVNSKSKYSRCKNVKIAHIHRVNSKTGRRGKICLTSGKASQGGCDGFTRAQNVGRA